MAEAILNQLGRGRFRAFSAGSHPAGRINPYTIEQLKKAGHPTDGLSSKSWDVFDKADAPSMDLVITVCDNAAGEVCPVWPGKPVGAHWGFEDPAAFEGSDEARRAKFDEVYRRIAARVRTLVSLPVERLDRTALAKELKAIGERSV